MDAAKLHPCTYSITYQARLTGTASEDERRALVAIYDEEDQQLASHGLPAAMKGSGAKAGHPGECVPVHASVTIGHHTVHRLLQPGDCCASICETPSRLRSTTTPAAALLEALKADGANHWDGQPTGQRFRAGDRRYRTHVFNRAVVHICNQLHRRFACWKTPRLPVLPLSAKIYILLILGQTITGFGYSVNLMLQVTGPCDMHWQNTSSSGGGSSSSGGSSSNCGSAAGNHSAAYLAVEACAIEAAHGLFFASSLTVGAGVAFWFSMRAIILCAALGSRSLRAPLG